MPIIDASFSQAVTAVAVLFTAVIGVYNSIRGNKRDRKLESIEETGKATHTLSNSAMGAQLKNGVALAKQSAAFAHRAASLTGEAGDVAAAKAADQLVADQEAMLQTHLVKQAAVDAELAARTA